jgi:acyl-coenzyme A thioesterase PaaI-like protein
MSGASSLEGLDPEAFWERYAAILGPGGLITYRYVGSNGAVALDRHHAVSTARVRRDLRGSTGILAAALSIMGGDADSAIDDAIAIPAPVHLTMELLDDGAGVDEVRIHTEITYEGRTQLVYRKRWEDAADPGRLLAVGTSLGAVVGPAPPGHRYVPPGPGVADEPGMPALWEGFGAQRLPTGGYRLPPLDATLGSTSASLHQGPTQVVLEAAAIDAAAAAAGGHDLQTVHWDVSFVRRGKAGPFRTAAEVVGASAAAVTVRAELHDEGVDDRVVALATAVFRPR